MEEYADLTRLSYLAKLASPAQRRSTPKHDSHNIVPNNQPIIRCKCMKINPTDEMIKCNVCGCMSHIHCFKDIENEKDWICPFCSSSQADILNSNGIDLQAMHHAIRNSKATGHYEEVVRSAQKISQVTKEFRKAASWVEAVCCRDDIYNSILETSDACIEGDVSDEINQELNEERALMNDLSRLLHKIADESENLPTSALSCIVDQIKTHPL